MNYKIRIFFGCCVLMACSNAFAQQGIGPLVLDPSFANNGKSEIDFEGFGSEATCFVANKVIQGQLNRILAAGKIYTSTPGEIRFGVVEYDANGTLESGFGVGGKADLSWTGFDYPNATALLPDGKVLAAGASNEEGVPAFFRLNSNGTPDSSFGDRGLASAWPPLTFQYYIAGEFENLDTLRIGTGDTSMRYLAEGLGVIVHMPGPKDTGFYAVRVDDRGRRDMSFGSNFFNAFVPAFVPAPIRVAQGHLIPDGGILFAGITDTGTYPEILLCKLLPNGTPDSSFGTNGVLNTGITLHGGDQIQSEYDSYVTPPNLIPSDSFPGLLVAAPIADSSAMLPFTIVKFKLDGTLDSNYGQNGFAVAPVISNMKVHGMTVHANNGNAHICGSIGDVSAVVQFISNGTVDPTFGTNGVAIVDADSGLRKNFLIGFEPASKRFIGIGTSINVTGNDDFFVARYMPGSAAVSPAKNDNSQTIQLFPNPAHSFMEVQTPNGTIEHIALVDALGRIVLSFERPSYAANSNSYYLDVSEIPNGTYNCAMQTTTGIFTERFTVIH